MNENIAKKAPKRVAIYLRVSTEDQLDGYGPDTQRDAVMNLIKARSALEEPFVYAGDEHVYFDEGISGTIPLDERDEFARLKEAIELAPEDNRPFDVVAVYRIDRFARKLTVLLDVIDFFEGHGIEFVSVTENIDTSSPFGKAILSIIGVIAELEIETIKQRTQAGREQAIKVGVHMGNAPVYGYRKTADKKLETFEDEMVNVKTVFDLFVNQKYTVGQIASYLKEHKVLSPNVSAIINKKRAGEVRKQNSNFHWSHESVRRILRDELYTGRYYYGKTKKGKVLPKSEWKISPYSMPLIIGNLMFDKAQKIIESSKHTRKQASRRKTSYLLSGLLRCNNCYDQKNNGLRQHWVGSSKKIKSSSKYTHYYSCGRKSTSKYERVCSVLHFPALPIEDYIVKQCLELLKSPVAVFKHQQKLKSEKVALNRLKKKIGTLNNLLAGTPARRNNLLEQNEHSYLDREGLNKKMNEVDKSEKRYIKELREAERLINENTLSDGYIKTLDLFDEKYQKVLSNVSKYPKQAYEVLHLLIDEVVVYTRQVTSNDKIAGRPKENQQIPERIHIKLKLPQDILNEIGKQKTFTTEKAPLSGGTSSSQKNISGAR